MVNKKILVTGSAGFIGSHLVDELVKQNYEIFCMDNHFPGWGNHYLNLKAHQINGDIRNFDSVDFATKNIDVVIHLAALSHVKTCLENPKLAYDINVGGTVNVLESCRKNNVKRVIIASSDHIFGRNPEIPVKETSRYEAANESDVYGMTKLFQLRLSQLYYKQYGLPVVITASGNVYGKNQSRPNLIPNFIYALKNNENLIIHGDGNQTRDFYNIIDLCKAYQLCIETPNIDGELFTFGSGIETSINYIAEILLELYPENKSKIVHIEETKLNAMNRMCIDYSKAKKILNWEPKIKLKEGLKMMVNNI